MIQVNSTTFMSNYNGYYSLAGYDDIVVQALEAHLADFDHQSLFNKGFVILLMSVTFEVLDKPVRGQRLMAKVTDGGCVGPIFRKNVYIYLGEKLMVRAAGFFGCINLEKRKLVMDVAELIDCPVVEENFPASSRCNREIQGEFVRQIRILPSHIDALGHCNNQRYYEFVYDCLNSDQRSMEHFSRIEMHFVSEIKENELLNIYMQQDNNQVLFVGLKENGNVCFKAVLDFTL